MQERQEHVPSVPLQQFAAISAAVSAGLPRSAALAEAGVSEEAWESAQLEWLARLGNDAGQGELALSRRCVEQIAAENPRAVAKVRELRKKPKGPMPEVPVARVAIHAPRAAEKLAEPPPSPSPPPLPPHEVPRQPMFDDSEVTGVVMISAPPREVLPFHGGAPAPAPKTDAPRNDGALPFIRPIEASTTPTLLEIAPPRDDLRASHRQTLPFVDSTQAPARPQPQQESSWALPFNKPQAQPSPAITPPQATPSESMLRAQRMSLVDYARLCAESQVYPDHVAWVCERYGLDEAAWRALHTLWQELFKKDPSLHAHWQRLVAQHMAQMR